MNKSIKILIVESKIIIGANIAMQLTKIGYEITALLTRGEDALYYIKKNLPDILLLDIQLKGAIDGIETAKLIQEQYDIPIVYLTANSDETHFNKVKEVKPIAFISKPFKKIDLKKTLELIANRIKQQTSYHLPNASIKETLKDRIFIKNREKFTKILLEDIQYIKAERNYCRIYFKQKNYLLVNTLKDFYEKLPSKYFFRVHRSYIVNLLHIDELSNGCIIVSKKAIPISKTLKEGLLNKLQTI